MLGHTTLQKFNATRHYTSNRSITDDGVLIGTPFGKRLRVKIKNMTTNDLLVMQPKNDDGDADDEITGLYSHTHAHTCIASQVYELKSGYVGGPGLLKSRV